MLTFTIDNCIVMKGDCYIFLLHCTVLIKLMLLNSSSGISYRIYNILEESTLTLLNGTHLARKCNLEIF
jgi:hypothetical protein